jgi:hypothetical protein
MGEMLVLFVVLVSSSSAYFLGRRWTAANSSALRNAIDTMLECVGIATLFLGVNTVLGLVLIFMIRGVTSQFVSLYMLAPFFLIVVSILQGFIFGLWWRHEERSKD